MIKKLFSILLLFFAATIALFAQDTQPEMADVLRQNGKIYNVVAVVLIVLFGIFIYLFVTERKLAKLENRIKK